MSVSQQFTEVFNTISEKFGVAIDWTQVNVMPYMEQLAGNIIRYELWTSVALIIASVIALIASYFGIKLIGKLSDEGIHDELCAFLTIGTLVITIVAVVFLFIETGDVITTLTLPEKVILDFIQPYIK